MQIYLVGGAVRDDLLGYPYGDRDWVVVGARPSDMTALGYQPVGKDFPVFLHPETHEEYALARTERKSGVGYKGFHVFAEPSVTLEEDLIRRDLTINAMARSQDGDIIDPYGGQNDLQNKLLRHVSPAFSEDPLRVIRVARFAARYEHLGFTIAPETLNLMAELSSEQELLALSKERVCQEFVRALNEKSPWVFLSTLKACGALSILMPELQQACAVSQLTSVNLTPLNTCQRYALLCQPLTNNERQTLNERLQVSNDFADASKITAALSVTEQEPSKLLDQLNTADAWRKPERLDTLLSVVELINEDQASRLKRALSVAITVQARDFVEQGLKGKAIGEAVAQQRLRNITEAL